MDEYIIITGGAGYIGSHTNKLLWQKGLKTIVIDNLCNDLEENAPLNASYQYITAKSGLKILMSKLDHVLDKVNFIYDKNFDKFEMYSLRNIFRIPDDLGDKTKVDIDIENSSSSSSSDDKTYSEADEKNIDNKRYQLLQEIVSLRRENKRFARK